MALAHSPQIVTSGLVLALDAANIKSYDKYENLLTYSRVSTANWVAINSATVTENSATSPDGTNNATQIAGAAIAASGVYRIFSLTSGNVYTYSLFVKSVSGANTIYFGSDGGTTALITINTSTGVASTNAGSPTNITSVPYPNGWYRISFTFTASATTNHSLVIYNLTASANTWLVYGVQVERNSTATDYYETTTTAKTRGTTCTDLSGRGSIGELISFPTYGASSGGSFGFNGSNYIIIPNSTALDTQTPTIELWIKTNATTQNGFWFEKGIVNSQYSLFQESGYLVWRHIISGVLTNLVVNPTSSYMNTSSWYQVVATYTSGSRKLYVNGVLAGSDTQSGTIDTNSGGMSIGIFGGYTATTGRGYAYNGNLAVCRVYNKELSVAEIQQNFNALRGRFGI